MKKKIIIISAIAVVLIGAIIGAIFGLSSAFAGDKGNKSSDNSSQVSNESKEDTESKDNVETDASADSETNSSSETGKTESTVESKPNVSDNKPTDATITVGNAETKKGSIVKVPVNIDKNPGFTAALLNFNYDTSVIKYLGYEKGDVLSDYQFVDKDGTLKFLCLENKDVNKDGLLFYIKFEVLKGNAETDIKLTVDQVVNYDEEGLDIAGANGKITVK